MPQTAVRTGVTLNYEITGEGEPVLLIMGTSGSIPLWGEIAPRLAQDYQVIAFDNRGLGGSERGEGQITVASLAEDASALLEALEIPRAHALGWSLGSAIIQELALAHPDPGDSAGWRGGRGAPPGPTTRWPGGAASALRPWSSSVSRPCSPRRGRRRRW